MCLELPACHAVSVPLGLTGPIVSVVLFFSSAPSSAPSLVVRGPLEPATLWPLTLPLHACSDPAALQGHQHWRRRCSSRTNSSGSWAADATAAGHSCQRRQHPAAAAAAGWRQEWCAQTSSLSQVTTSELAISVHGSAMLLLSCAACHGCPFLASCRQAASTSAAQPAAAFKPT